MAAPVEIEDANWHRSKQLHKECGWKRGDSAMVNPDRDAGGDRGGSTQRQEFTGRKRRRKTDLTLTGLLMEGDHPGVDRFGQR